jgi:very-short-patch-repair endonuclease
MDPHHRTRARQVRKNPTDAERLLWLKLRFWQVEGLKFRRQQPLGPHIVDFVCLEKRLVVEVDGGQHAENTNYDTQRDDWLRDQGFAVLRFWNHDILKNITDVTERIFQTLQSTPYLNPSPQGDCVPMHELPILVISSGARDLAFSATCDEKISRLGLEMTIATQSQGEGGKQ